MKKCWVVWSLVAVLAGCLPGPVEPGSEQTVVTADGNYRELSLIKSGGVDGSFVHYTYVPATRRLSASWRYDGSGREQVELTPAQASELEAALGGIRLDTAELPARCAADAFDLRLEYVDAAGQSWSYHANRQYRCPANTPDRSFVREEDFQAAFVLCQRLLPKPTP